MFEIYICIYYISLYNMYITYIHIPSTKTRLNITGHSLS